MEDSPSPALPLSPSLPLPPSLPPSLPSLPPSLTLPLSVQGVRLYMRRPSAAASWRRWSVGCGTWRTPPLPLSRSPPLPLPPLPPSLPHAPSVCPGGASVHEAAVSRGQLEEMERRMWDMEDSPSPALPLSPSPPPSPPSLPSSRSLCLSRGCVCT